MTLKEKIYQLFITDMHRVKQYGGAEEFFLVSLHTKKA